MSQELVPKRGAISTLSLEVERELTVEDLLDLEKLPPNGPPPIKTLSARHRRQAQMIAAGNTPGHVADALGTTVTRIYQLQKDPAFKELVEYYRDQIHEKSLDDEQRFQAKLRAGGEMAIDIINDRLEGQEDQVRISTSELRQIATMAADRTVAPPKAIQNNSQIPQNITLNFGTSLRPKNEPEIIDITPETEE